MYMKKALAVIAVIIILLVLQLFFRYETAQVGPIELKYDKLTDTIYERSTKNRTWKQSRFDDFKKAKIYYKRNGWAHVQYD